LNKEMFTNLNQQPLTEIVETGFQKKSIETICSVVGRRGGGSK